MTAIEKYLAQYAEPDCLLLADFPAEYYFKYCIALPVCDESFDCVIRIESRNFSSETLLVVVLNQSSTLKQIEENNLAFRWLLKMNSRTLWCKNHLSLLEFGNLKILLLERFQENLLLKASEGVGRARKLAGDLALFLFNNQQITGYWLYSTDADAQLPQNYFYKPDALQASAMVFEFEHVGNADDEIYAATKIYESSIKYFRDALAWAGSPYAFTSLGSALAVHFEAYAQARGFPARAGGEDFYLLNKVAKLGNIKFHSEVLIQIQARLSERVPFGTGPAVKKILEQQARNQDYCYYNPQIFMELKTLLANLDTLFSQLIHQNGPYPWETIASALEGLKFGRFREHCLKQKIRSEDFAKHFHIWFDAFQTLKFIHRLRESQYPDLPLASCLQQFRALDKET